MKKTASLFSGWILVIALVFINIFKNPHAFFSNGTIILGWLLLMLQLTWNYSEYFYMKIKKIWFIIKNPDCIWNMMVEFNGDFNRETFNIINDFLGTEYTNLKITKISKLRSQYRIGSLCFEINIDEDTGVLNLFIEDLEVSYRRSRKLIDEEMGFLLENLSKKLKEDNSEYYFKISFKEFNPFYGFFLRRLNATDIKKFNVMFNVEDNKVTINKNTIEIYTTSLQKLNSLSKEYLSLSPR